MSAEPVAFLSAAGAEPPAGAELPDDAQVCSCNAVTAGDVRGWISGEHGDACTDIGTLKACSRAGTQCGSCVPLVKKILDTELTRAGVAVSDALCEHIEMSRSALFEAVRVLGLGTADEVYARFGTGGYGCDVCKPVVASVLATQTNAYILDGGSGPLQDTNDRALANMQKDGTYSVVPRIPPARSPQPSSRSSPTSPNATGSTRRSPADSGSTCSVHDSRATADIWRELVDAGFESGQAYGKALRNVKSCVGSTWCRFGVQDSVAMAIFLEERYRGLRSPHKFKMGVSGCARECAEARGKDVGVIATENGWNLYVGGNGGFQPAHAQLLATDVDSETLVRYIDRYLMYYIRTAERLQRTARWQEELDGGLDHVRAVVCEDSLGIAEELEAAIAAHVDGYEDEWRRPSATPRGLRRFRSFVNAPDTPDPSILRVPGA